MSARREREKREKSERERGCAHSLRERGGEEGSLPLVSFTSTLCIQTSCALTRPCGLDSISRNELRGTARGVPRRCAFRGRGNDGATRCTMHSRRAQPCHPTTRRNWIFSRCFAIERQRRTYRRRLSTFAGNRSALVARRSSRSSRKRRYFTGTESTEVKHEPDISVKIARWK